ncbi:MAG: SRPBCC family protein [bacterium]|nr:SRPBCC family protein [bacterium]
MILEDSIKIHASAEVVFNCLIKSISDKKSYKAWHHEHEELQWIKGAPSVEGSIMYIEEYLQGYLLKQKYKIIKVIPNKRIKYRVLFPLSIFAPENNFFIEPIDENS